MSYVWQVCLDARQAFDAMIERTPVLVPFVLVVIGSLVVFVLSFAVYSNFLYGPLVSQDYYYEIINIPRRYDVVISPAPFTITGVLVAASEYTLDLGLRLLLLATYFFVVARVLQVESKWGNWFGFVCWTQIPLILLPGAKFVPWLWHTGFYSHITMLVCEIVFLVLPLMWAFFISVRGMQSWTSRRSNLCVGLTLIPYYIMFMWYSPAIFPFLIKHSPIPG